MSRRKACPRGTCTWAPLRGGQRERCTACGDEYPCAHACGHYDCKLDKGLPLPPPPSL